MNSPASLGVVLTTNSTDRGSTSRTLEAWSRHFPRHGIIPVVTIGGSGPLQAALEQSGIDVSVHPIRHFFDWRRPTPFLAAIARLAIRIRRSGARIMHVNEHEHYPVAVRAAWLAGVPAVVHVRFTPTPEMCRWLFKSPYTPRRVFFTSRQQRDDVGEAVAAAVPPARFRLVYDGLDFETFGVDLESRQRVRDQWGLSPTTIAIGTASSLSPRKQLSHFIRIVVALSREGLNVRGFIAGKPYFDEDEAELASLRRLITELDAERLISFLGYVEPVEPLFHAWDVCLSTSNYETFGMSVLEAMTCGCPMLAYAGGSVAEVVGEGGVVVANDDFEELLTAARKIVVDAGYRTRMGANALSRSRQFDVTRSVEQLAEEYRAIIAEDDAAGLSRRRSAPQTR